MTARAMSPTAVQVHTRKICAVETCDRPAGECRGLCNAHYSRWRRDGDVRADVPLGKLKSAKAYKQCSVESCEQKADARGAL